MTGRKSRLRRYSLFLEWLQTKPENLIINLINLCPLKPPLMEQAGISQHRTTYLISLTLVKVESNDEPGIEMARQSVEQATSQDGSGRPPNADVLQNQKPEQTGKDVQPKSEQEILPSPGDHKTVLTDGAHPSDKQKSISSFTEGAKEATGPGQASSKKQAELRPLSKSNDTGHVHKRPVSLLRTHSGALSGRELKEVRDNMHSSSKSLDRKDSRSSIQSPASPAPNTFRASWAVCDAKPCQDDLKGGNKAKSSTEGVIAMRTQSPRAERLKAGSISLPAPVTVIPKPQRKGKSRTLDNSDLNCLSEDLLKGKGAHMMADFRQTSTRDRKMLKFISGIFSKNTQVTISAGNVPQVPCSSQRGSSEDEGRSFVFFITAYL